MAPATAARATEAIVGLCAVADVLGAEWVLFRVEPTEDEYDRGPVWIGTVDSQVRWGDRAGMQSGVVAGN